MRSVQALLYFNLACCIAADPAAAEFDLSPFFGAPGTWLDMRHISHEFPADEPVSVVDSDSEGGMIWNKRPLPCGAYRLSLGLTLSTASAEEAYSTRFDGVGVWIVPNTTLPDIVTNYAADTERPLLDYRGDYTGLGLFLAVENRQKNLRPSVSVWFNDGAPMTLADVPTEFGLYYDFLTAHSIMLDLDIDGSHVIPHITDADSGDRRRVSNIAGARDVCGFLGISASNKRAVDGAGIAVDLASVRLTTPDPNYAAAFLPEKLQPDEEPSKLEAESLPRRSADDEIATRIISGMLHRLEQQQAALSEEVRSLSSLLQAESSRSSANRLEYQKDYMKRQTELEATIRELREQLAKHQNAGGGAEKSLQNLQANAASLEGVIRRATTYSTYFAGALSISFLIFGGVIYKRMKDMEKKHFL